MKIGFVQFDVKFEDKETNFKKISSLIDNKYSNIWVLPELFNTGYVFISRSELEKLAEPVPHGKTTQFLLDLSKKANCAFVAGLAERADDKIFNSAVVVDRGNFLGIYRKIHLFNREKLVFDPGNAPFRTFNISGVSIGVMICFDWIFPEAMRTLALKGAQIICHPSNLVMPYCQNAMTTRCLENRLFAVTANRIGIEKRGELALEFTGGSQITGVKGEVIYRSEKTVEEAFVAEINPSDASSKKLNELNDLFSDRRPEFYFD